MAKLLNKASESVHPEKNNHDHEHNGCGGHSHAHCGCSHSSHELPKWLVHILSGIGLVLAIVGIVMIFMRKEKYELIAFAASYVAFGVPVFYGLIMGIREKNFFNENLLMTVASLGALFIGDAFEAVMVMLLFRAGEMLEDYAGGKAERSIKELLKLRPKTVRLKTSDGKYKMANPEKLVPGDVIIVRPGETVGADGVVSEGRGEMNTASITGESLPVSVKPGSEVLFGYININTPIEIRVTKSYADGTFAKIVRTMKENIEKKSRYETFISRFAKVYTPIVMIAALMVFAIGSIVTRDVVTWLYRALVFLAISCPCALVISVPLTFFAGLGYISKEGLLLKGSECIEKLANIKVCAFDKTGTLTCGKIKVAGVEAKASLDVNRIMSAAVALESESNHPMARAIIEEGKKYDLVDMPFESVLEIPGMGMKGISSGSVILCGNKALLESEGVDVSNEDGNFTGVYVACDKILVGRIMVSDNLRDGASALFAGLREKGIRTMILTGDRGAAVNSCRDTLHPDEIYSGLLPHEKSEKFASAAGIKNGKKKNKRKLALYLGDGINDAPVMALADVGIAMGLDGADVTIETADGILMNEKPEILLRAIELSRKIAARARINVAFAVLVKLSVLVLSAFGYASMWLAMLADVGVLIAVLINSIRRYSLK